MKYPFNALLLAFTAAALLAGCKENIEPEPEPKPTIVRVTGVEVDKRSVVLEEGESEVITATVLPENATNKTFTWESTDASIATVDNSGKVTGVKAGETSVIVTTADGPCRVVCEVLVKSKTIAVTGVELD